MRVIDPYMNDHRISNIEKKVKDLCDKIDLLEERLVEEEDTDGQKNKRSRTGKEKRSREGSKAEA